MQILVWQTDFMYNGILYDGTVDQFLKHQVVQAVSMHELHFGPITVTLY